MIESQQITQPIIHQLNEPQLRPKLNHFITDYITDYISNPITDCSPYNNHNNETNAKNATKAEVNNIMLKDFKPRLYQQTILSSAAEKNVLVVLPTGMGKTSIALMLAIQRLNNYPKSKVLVLAPTKPLAEQHKTTFLAHIDNVEEEKFAIFTGNVLPSAREEQWKSARIIFSTPQGLENDLISGRISMEDVSLLVFDEAHRATGDYAYCFIAKHYMKQAKYPRILGLTASPGSDMQKIMDICRNIYIEDLEIRTEEDADVKPYIKKIDIEWHKVSLPASFQEIQKYLADCYESKLKEVVRNGYLNANFAKSMSKTELLGLQARLHGEIASGNKDFRILKSISLLAEAMKVGHALELLETQEITSLLNYMEKLRQQAASTSVKAVQNLVSDIRFKSALIKARSLMDINAEHPKLTELKALLGKYAAPDKKIIIFNQYRDTAVKIEQEISKLPNVNARIFVGQAKKGITGLSQKKQKEIIGQFAKNEFNVLIATSVAEEGLDIPAVDLVVFYEPIPSAIRHIQRRGRTGRLEKGHVIVLTTKDTRDESYRWAAFHKERRMYRNLEELKKTFKALKLQDINLQDYAQQDSFMILADDREKGSPLMKEIVEKGIKITLKRLHAGDYMLSPRCVVECKRVPDFVDSIIDGRLLEQLKLLKNFDKPLVIIEGEEDIYSQRRMHPNAIRGMLSTIAVNFGIPILQTKNFRETAELFGIIAKKEQEDGLKGFEFHSRKPVTLKEKQEYLVSSLPGIGNTLARPLLEKFKSIKNLANASVEELQQVEKIGEKKAGEIQRVLQEGYE